MHKCANILRDIVCITLVFHMLLLWFSDLIVLVKYNETYFRNRFLFNEKKNVTINPIIILMHKMSRQCCIAGFNFIKFYAQCNLSTHLFRHYMVNCLHNTTFGRLL